MKRKRELFSSIHNNAHYSVITANKKIKKSITWDISPPAMPKGEFYNGIPNSIY